MRDKTLSPTRSPCLVRVFRPGVQGELRPVPGTSCLCVVMPSCADKMNEAI